jgi:type I restriction enzyme S subunit
MSFPRYPKYKDSGVEWLGEVPEGWDCRPIKHFGKLKGGAGFPHAEQGLDCEEICFHKVNALAQADSHGDLLPSDNTISRMTAARLGAYIFPPKSIVFAKVGAALLLGRIRCLRAEACIDNNMMGLVVYSGCCPRFVMYALLLVRFDLIANPGAVPSLNEGQIGNFILAAPSPAEQQTIATFLDRETAKIDALVGEQEKLIALLKEKRQAVISHAVTKGLDPTAPLKDSGIEWLGEVPASWQVCPLKRLGRIGNGSTPNRDKPYYWAEEGFPWLNSSVVNQDEVTEAQRFVTPLALKECHLPIVVPPAVLVGITGQGKTRGMTTRLAFTATVNQHVAYIKPYDCALTLPYLLNVLESAYEHLRTGSEGAGSTKGAITCEQLGRLRIPLPTLAEQLSIATYLDRETTKLDTLTAEAQRAIDLLKERRSALISAAVTGKIDVRGYHAPSQPIV